ncbi:MAG: hypothetical protein HYY95_01195 [Candidatus Rokubacteria bacterium]|nr:hypothetical protein [Candidatus Rokubacteria bacterium]MBI3104202.1 hypothetical protein [Candidatus Rokubacteria bacterium]
MAALSWAAPAIGQDGYREGTVANGATIAGEVSHAGAPPAPFVIWVKKNADVFGEKLPDERVIVSRTGKIKNVLVALEGIKGGKRWSDHRPQLLNRGGLFVPHLQAARTGSQLEVTNQDPVLHNTHAYVNGRTLFNMAQPNKGQVIQKSLKRSGMVELMCDAHDWMNGWIAVLDHPYFALTGEDGTYTIADVPPGTYTLTAWHEKLGRQQLPVTVKGNETKRMNLAFPAK